MDHIVVRLDGGESGASGDGMKGKTEGQPTLTGLCSLQSATAGTSEYSHGHQRCGQRGGERRTWLVVKREKRKRPGRETRRRQARASL